MKLFGAPEHGKQDEPKPQIELSVPAETHEEVTVDKPVAHQVEKSWANKLMRLLKRKGQT